MTTVSAHELAATYDCKIPGCTNEATANRGPYALLCEVHKFEARRSMSQSAKNGHASRTATAASVQEAGGSYEQAAKTLVNVGRKVDTARKAYAKKRAEVQPAENELRRAMEEWRVALQKLGAAVGE